MRVPFGNLRDSFVFLDALASYCRRFFLTISTANIRLITDTKSYLFPEALLG
jgi:hypothetical protein